MRPTIELLRSERRAGVFFATLAQSSVGTGAGYVALLLIAYERLASPWAISLVLAADLIPAMLLGPVFGAAADRFSRRSCAVVADLLRAVAFLGIALVDGFAATVALAVLAGIGTGMFTPAALASLPSLVDPPRLPAATALYGAIADLGFMFGPALAAVLLLAGGPETILVVNGVTFAVSAAVLQLLPFGARPDQPARIGRRATSLLRDARAGMVATVGLKGLRTVLVTSSVALFFAGTFNVGELLFAKGELGVAQAGFSALVALFGLGFAGGSLLGSRGGPLPALKRNYLIGLAVMGAGFLASGLAPNVVAAGLTFTAAGFGNGLVLVYERLIIQATVPDSLAGRVFGIRDALTSWAFGLAFVVAAGLIELVGVRSTIVLAGAGGLVAWQAAVVLLRQVWSTSAGSPVGSGGCADPVGNRVTSQEGADLIRARNDRLALLDDLDEGSDDGGVELGSRISP